MIDLDQLNKLKVELLNQFDFNKVKELYNAQIEVNPKMRTTSGVANYTKNKIVLNEKLLNDNPHYIEQTFKHELAHLISVALHGPKIGRGHGHSWKQVMTQIKANPKRTHSLDVSKFKRSHSIKGYASCQCRVIGLKSKRYNAMTQGRKFRCLNCNSELILK